MGPLIVQFNNKIDFRIYIPNSGNYVYYSPQSTTDDFIDVLPATELEEFTVYPQKY